MSPPIYPVNHEITSHNQGKEAHLMRKSTKGVDDGIKTSKQHDDQEAVMNTKLQTIERAGAVIESNTKVVNFQLKYDAVESKSKAILLPGFQIIDIGYIADGTYQVVLIGKIQVEEKETKDKEVSREASFISYSNGTILDTRTNLMWAAKDNGSNINWKNAKNYCENYRGGGYTDWRMPTQDELAGLYNTAYTYKSACGYNLHLTELIRFSCTWTWASETRGSEAANFLFDSGHRYWSDQSGNDSYRVIPVRSGK
jgi:hypothetical protein